MLIERGMSSTSDGDAAAICGCNCCIAAGGVSRHPIEALLDETRATGGAERSGSAVQA